ncbi:MAG: YfhO family protein [Ruminococcus sp.]|nr:YfhO family protein [Ruminococcus sp.]
MAKKKAKASGKASAARTAVKNGGNSAKSFNAQAQSKNNQPKQKNNRFNGSKPVVGIRPARTAADILAETAGKKLNVWAILAAFAIPAILTLIAYIGFDVFPFGKRSVLTLDLNGQYIYYFEGLRDAFWGDGSALYNWSRNLSGGFMGIIGYYLASPFTLIVMLMPRTLILEAVMIMQICKVGAAGAAFCIYAQRSKRLGGIPSVTSSTAYALMSYVAIQLINPMWIDGPIFLPLIILGVEYLIDDGRKINYIIPTALIFIANFYIGFMVAIFVAIYFVYYLFFGTTKKYKKLADYARTCGVMVGSTVVVLMCSAIMILPVYNALALGKFDFSEPVYDWKERLFKLPELIPCLLPNQYYSVNVDTGTRFYGRPEIYCGVLTLVLAPLYFCNKKIKHNRKIGNAFLILVMVMSMYIKPLNMYWHGGQDPNWLPFRYSFLLSFILVSMAAEVFSHLDGYKLSPYSVGGTFAGVAVLALWFGAIQEKYNYNESKYKYAATFPYKDEMNYGAERWDEIWLGTLAIGVLLAGVYLAMVYGYSRAKKNNVKKALVISMAAVVSFEAGYNCYDSFRKIYKEVGNSCRDSYAEIIDAPNVVDALEKYDDGFYRAEKTYQRMVNDNMAYGLRGVSHSSSVMNTRAIRFLENLGYFTQSFESKYEGNSPIADSLLGIKYVIDDPTRKQGDKNILDASYNKVFSTNIKSYYEPQQIIRKNALDVYENPNALAIGYMADDDIIRYGSLGNENPFDNINNYLSALTGNTPEITQPVSGKVKLNPKQYYKRVELAEGAVNYDINSVYLHDYVNPSTGTVHDTYEARAGAADAVVNVNMTVPVDGDIYMHLGSEIKRQCNVWIGIKDETGEYHGRNSTLYDGCGTYFETNSSPIVRLGKFAKGEEIQVRFTIISTGPNNTYDGTDEYIMVRKNESDGGSGFHFYYLDREEFEKDINTLKAQQWEIDTDKSTERHLVGKVTAKANQLLVTSIPYEPGWTIKVDGKKLDSRIVEQEDEEGKVKLLNYDSGDGELILMDSVIGIRLGEGEHTVEMIYTPPGFNFGLVTLILGIGAIVMLYLYDRKKNSVLIARRKIKEQGASETDADKVPEKKVQIIKSKGAVSENVITAKQEDSSKNDEKNDKKSEEKAPETEKSDEESETPEKDEE